MSDVARRMSASHRDPALVRAIADELARRPAPDRTLRFMHVCGTHEHEIARFGLRRLMPPWVEVIAGPGCPVCVCPVSELDLGTRVALEHNAIVTTFGDLIRVPARISLAEARAQGADVRVVTSAAGAASVARENPNQEVVFLAVGFETTACTTAAVALADPPPNLSFLLSHRLVPPALDVLLSHPDLELDGYLLPGHVLAVEGTADYEALAQDRGLVMSVAGFEPVDILSGVLALVDRVARGEPGVDNRYPRVVRPEGNRAARAATRRVFEPTDAPWRGLGVIPSSGQAFREEFRHLDTLTRFDLAPDPALDVPDTACKCDEVLLGLRTPDQCPLFGRGCTPDRPYGPCMVSMEGTCAAWYRHPDQR